MLNELLLDFNGFGLKKAAGGAPGGQKAAWGALGTSRGAKGRTSAALGCPFGALLEPKTDPKPLRAVLEIVKKHKIFIAFLALGGSWGRLGGGRKTDRKTEPKKEAPCSQGCGCPWAVWGPPAGYAGPGGGVWGGKLPRNWLGTGTPILKTPCIRWMRRI